ncbi:hypothetical protein AVEN_167908-1 [Araneus ventricosus]|uniref:Histone-lysine N-methyltransferase SETMAR n=1 Tax=Araneus ventricosus TaxID=182803 RepID=A0A4Y2FWB6_ARAVE|nr:hypothetical protein AVEN_167908-1 [Araneus ventricosus]
MACRTDAPAKCEMRSICSFVSGRMLVCGIGSMKLFVLRRAILTSGVVFIRDNAQPHNADVTEQLQKQFKRDVSDQQAYNPDLGTCDFYLISELKNRKSGQNFLRNEEIQSNDPSI